MGIEPSYEAYLFDLDGTLINTTELIKRCFERSLGEVGIRGSDKDLLRYVGLPLRVQFESFLAGSGRAVDIEALMRSHMEYQVKVWRTYVRPYMGVRAVLVALQGYGRRLAVVTSRKKDTTDLYLKDLGLDVFFDVVITPENTQQHKPHPAPIHKALESLGVSRKKALFIGDSSFDMLAAGCAGIDSYFVTWGFGCSGDLRETPTYIRDSLDALLCL